MPIVTGVGEYGFQPNNFLGGYSNLSWVSRNRYDPNEHWQYVKPNGVGTIRGGPSAKQVYDLTRDPYEYTVVEPVRALGSPIFGGESTRPKTGNFTLDLVDWPNTFNSFTGTGINKDPAAVGGPGWSPGGPTMSGSAADPMTYLAQRNITMENAPVRMLDAAFAPVSVLGQMITGKGANPDEPVDTRYPFQKNPYYWEWLRSSSPAAREQQARMMADSMMDQGRNSPLYTTLLGQFNLDHDTLDGKSSGDARIDYLAKMQVQIDPFWTTLTNPAFRGQTTLKDINHSGPLPIWPSTLDPLLEKIVFHPQYSMTGRNLSNATVGGLLSTVIPFGLGSGLAAGVDPIRPETEAAWLAARPEDRVALLQQLGFATAASDMAMLFPVFGALGKAAHFIGDIKKVEATFAALNAGKFGTLLETFGIARPGITAAAEIATFAKAGGTSLRVLNLAMGVGVINTTAAWAMESFAPVDSEWARAGRAIDASRVISQSSAAGLLNEAGFFAGIYGIDAAAEMVLRGGMRTAQLSLRGARLFGGEADLEFHSLFGGSQMRTAFKEAGVAPEFQDAALNAEAMSALENGHTQRLVQARMAVERGEPTGIPVVDAITDPADRIRVWENEMARSVEHAHLRIGEDIDRLNMANIPGLPPKLRNSLQRRAREIDREITDYARSRYGVLRWPSTVAELKSEVIKRLEGLGATSGIKSIEAVAGKSPERWGDALRRAHQLLFHKKHVELIEVAEQAGEDATSVALFSLRTLFDDEVEPLVAKLTSGDYAEGVATMEALIRDKDQVQALMGEFSSPEQLADLLLAMRGHLPVKRENGNVSVLDNFQTDLEAAGLWTVGTKPTGNFTRVQPWVRIETVAPPRSYTRPPLTPEQLEAMGYRRAYPNETMPGREFIARKPIWPIEEFGGGVWVEARAGDRPPSRMTPTAAAGGSAEYYTLIQSYEWSFYPPYRSDMRPYEIPGTGQFGVRREYRRAWEGMGVESVEIRPGNGDRLPDDLAGYYDNVDVSPWEGHEQMAREWDQYGSFVPPDDPSISKAGVVVYERAGDGTIGIWAIKPIDKYTGEPFLGYDLTFPKGGRNGDPVNTLAGRMPPPRKNHEGGFKTVEEMRAWNLARRDEIAAVLDPDLLTAVEKQAGGVKVAVLDTAGDRFVAVKSSAAREGVDAGVEITAFGDSPDLALLALSKELEKAGYGSAATKPNVSQQPVETLLQAAAREMQEETGMHGRLRGHLGDFADENGRKVRYWMVERRSGGPDFALTPEETGSMELVDPGVLASRLTRNGKPTSRDQQVLEAFLDEMGLRGEIEGTGQPMVVHGRNYGADWPVLIDDVGHRYVFKAQRGHPIENLTESRRLAAPTAGKMYDYLGINTAAEVPYEWNGVKGTLQRFYENIDTSQYPGGEIPIENGTELVRLQRYFEQGLLRHDLIAELEQNHVADWFLSQHDTNSDAMLLLQDEHVGGIDKGQAWKYFGKGYERDAFYSPDGEGFWVFGEHSQTYFNPDNAGGDWHLGHLLLKAHQEQGLKLNRANVEDILVRIEALSDDDIRNWLTPLAEAREARGLGSADDFINAMIRRRDDMRGVVNKAYEHIGQIAIPRPGEAAVFKPGAEGTLALGSLPLNESTRPGVVSSAFKEPAWDVPDGSTPMIGVIVTEGDGRVWAMTNPGSHGPRRWFPQNVVLPGPDGALDGPAAAISAAKLELGLDVRIESHIADIQSPGGQAMVRWYRASRIGGGPKWSSTLHDETRIMLDRPEGIRVDPTSAEVVSGAEALDLLTKPPEAIPTDGNPTGMAWAPDDGAVPGRAEPPADPNQYASYTILPNGSVFRSPWHEYPVQMANQVQLGNRAILSQKLDAVFKGWRTARLLELQKGALYRSLDGKSAVFTPFRIQQFHEGLVRLANKYEFAGIQPLGLSEQWTRFPGLRNIYDSDVKKLAEEVFGKGPYLGRDGNLLTVDWGVEIAKAYRTSLKLNLTAGITSHIKAMGYAGAQMGMVSDVVYPAFRFGLSPMFKAGEWFEGYAINGMRGTNPFGNPMDEVTRSLWQRSGMPTSGAEFLEESLADPMLANAGHSRYSRALRSAWLRTAAPEGYAAEARRMRMEGPITAADELQPPRSLGETLFPPMRPEGMFPVLPQHNVQSLIPHTTDPLTGDVHWDEARMVELDAARVDEYNHRRIYDLLEPAFDASPAKRADALENIAYGVAYLRRVFTEEELDRLALNVPILHNFGGSGVDVHLDRLTQMLADGVDPLSGPATRGPRRGDPHAGQVEAHVLETGEVAYTTYRPNTSAEEQFQGMLDAPFAGHNFWSLSGHGVYFTLRNERVLPRGIITNTDRISLMRDGPTDALNGHVLSANGAVALNKSAIKLALLRHAKSVLEGSYHRNGRPSDLLDVLPDAFPSSTDPLEYAFPHGGTWEDIAQIWVDTEAQADRFRGLQAQWGDTVPGLREVEIVVNRTPGYTTIRDAWEYAMRKAGLSDRIGSVFEPGMLAADDLKPFLLDEFITPNTVREAEGLLQRRLNELGYGVPQIRMSLEDSIRLQIATLRVHMQERVVNAYSRKSVQKASAYGGTADPEALRLAWQTDASSHLADNRASAEQITQLETLLEEITAWRTSRRGYTVDEMLGELHPNGDLNPDAQDFLDTWSEFKNRARAAGVNNLRSHGGSTTFEYGPRSSWFVNKSNTAQPALRGELPPAEPYLHHSGDTIARNQNVAIYKEVSRFVNEAQANEPLRVGFSTFVRSLQRETTAGAIATDEFINELAYQAAVKTGMPTQNPVVHVWMRGELDGMSSERGDGDIVITVNWPDHTSPLTLDEIRDIWMKTGFPAEQHSMSGRMGPQDAWEAANMLYSPDGGPAGSIMMRDQTHYTIPKGSWQTDPVSGHTTFYPDLNEVQPASRRPIEFLYSFDAGDKPYALNLTTGEKLGRPTISTTTDPHMIPGGYGRLGDSTEYRYQTTGNDAEWVYGAKEFPTFTVIDIARETGRRSAVEEVLRDAMAQYGGRGPLQVNLRREQHLMAAARLRMLGELPEGTVYKRIGEFWPDSNYDPNFEMPVTDAELNKWTPRKPPADPGPDTLEGTPGSHESVTDHLESWWQREIASATGTARGRLQDGWETWKNPIPSKQAQQDKLILDIVKKSFPDILEVDLPHVFDLYHNKIGVPRDELVQFILQDRALLDRWLETGSMADFERLVQHADKYGIAYGDTRAELDSLYESPDWQTTVESMRWTGKSAQTEAFGAHFFNRDRSTFERSINHPLLGIYPASWSYKMAKEWFRFLYRNHTFGFNLGMQPARYIGRWTNAQQEQVAQEGGDLDAWYQNGPWSSSIFLFNLLMPGDWSNLPFPLSRSLRDMLRGNFNPADHFKNNIASMGVGRDARLLWETGNEIKDALTSPVPLRRANEEPVRR